MQRWTGWCFKGQKAGEYLVDDIVLVGKSLSIKLFWPEDVYKIEILYKNGVASFSHSGKSECLKITDILLKSYGDYFYTNSRFFQVKKSEYLDKLAATSYGVSDMFSLKHFCVLGKDEVVDIITNDEPEVKILN